MLQKTRGIVFRSSEYGETSLVVQIYTELFGIQSCIINSVRKKHARIHSNIFQPLTPLDLVIYYKERPGIQRISDVRPNPQLTNIPFNIAKTSIVFFLDEILCKSIREEEPNPALFEFIFNSVLFLDRKEAVDNNFNLVFLMRLCRYFGFNPQNNFDNEHTIFNLREGLFQSAYPDHPHFISPPLSKLFSELIDADFEKSFNFSPSERSTLTSLMLEYYALHIEGFGNIKSQKVLEQVWGD